MHLIATGAIGFILFKSRQLDDALLFIAFLIYAFSLTMTLFFGDSINIDVENNVTNKITGVLSLNQTIILELMAGFLITVSFVMKANKIVKKT